MLRIFCLILCYLIVTAPLAASAGSATSNTCLKKLKIGVSLPLSAGPVSSGLAVRNSILLADQKYDKSDCVQFLIEDDQLLAKNTITNVNKFISSDKVDGLLVYGTPTSLAVVDIAEKAAVPMIALSILGKVVQNKSFVVKHWCTAETLTKKIAEEVKKRDYRRVAIVSTQNDAMLGLRDLFRQGNYAEVVLDEEYNRDNFDFRSSILKIQNAKVDAVYVLLYPPQTGVFMRQLRNLGVMAEAFGVHNVEDPGEVKVAAGAMSGMWLANADDSTGENFRTEYIRKYSAQPSLGGSNGFDAAKIFIQATQQDQNLNWLLHNIKDFSGAQGFYSSSKANDFNIKAAIKIVEPDGFRVAE